MRWATRDLATVTALGGCASDPLRFVLTAFAWGEGELADHAGPDKWQTEVLRAIGDHLRLEKPSRPLRVAVASGHGVGKSALVAWLILWAMTTRPHLAAVVTANTQRQLETKTWRELALWHKRLVNRHWFAWSQSKLVMVNHPDTWFAAAVPWSRERPEAFAGLHGRHVMVIYDEASAIPNEIWDVSEGAMTTPGAMWFAFGNPTRNTGRFRDCFMKSRTWTRFKVDARTSRLVNQAQVQAWIAEHGVDSDFVRIRVTGRFPSQSNWQFISRELTDRARASPGVPFGPLVMGIDVARFGDDQTVFLLRQGEAIKRIERIRGADTMRVAGRAAEAIDRSRPAAVFIDGVGVGGGVVDRLKQLGFPVIEVNGGSRATDDRRYANRRAEMWARVREWLQAGGCLPREDAALADELCAPEYGYDASNRIILEKKDDMKKRGLASPDAADALALTFADPVWVPADDEPPPRIETVADYDPLKW
ncbi:MAG: terminase [Gemmatimonas sp.]